MTYREIFTFGNHLEATPDKMKLSVKEEIMQNRKAFTLTELLGTIIVMSILGGVAINVFFPSLTKTYVAMIKHDASIQAQEDLEYYTKHGKFVYSGSLLSPAANGKVQVGKYEYFEMSNPSDQGMRYEVRFGRGTCADTGKPGMLLEYWLNRSSLSKTPVLYGKYDSCTQSKVRVWEQVYKDGKKVWEER